MSSFGAAAPVPEISVRARASRINGAKSRGPRTEEGKARSSRNALKHGLRAQKLMLVEGEDAAEFEGLEAALADELAPVGVLQSVLVQRIARATWRLSRADRMEVELFERDCGPEGDLGLALIRDGNGARAFPTLLRYRGAALAELWRALRTLKALQAEEGAASRVREAAPAPVLVFAPKHARAGTSGELAPEEEARQPEPCGNPIEPEGRANPGESGPAPAAPVAPVADQPKVPEMPGAAGAERDPATLEPSARPRRPSRPGAGPQATEGTGAATPC
jgi:hypothetical protein